MIADGGKEEESKEEAKPARERRQPSRKAAVATFNVTEDPFDFGLGAAEEDNPTPGMVSRWQVHLAHAAFYYITLQTFHVHTYVQPTGLMDRYHSC